MNLLEELIDENFPDDKDNILFRNAGRAIIFDENELTPLLFVSKYNYHKIAGGGVESKERI